MCYPYLHLQDWANLSVCDHIHCHPVIPLGQIISEVYHAKKWQRNVDQHTLSPMYDPGSRHYYINELAHLKNDDFIIPVQWLEDTDRNVFVDAYTVILNDQVGSACYCYQSNYWLNQPVPCKVINSEVVLVKASDLQDNFLDLIDLKLVPAWSGEL